MKDHEKRELVDTLTAIAREYAGTQQLRERISHVVLPALEDVVAAYNAGAEAEREACAVAAWMAGIDAHNKALGMPCDAREVGSSCAIAIRARSKE